MSNPAGRLALVQPAVPVRLDGAMLVESWSNDTWLTDRAVLRVCWRGDRSRLLREEALLDSLPDTIPHAEVLGAGETCELTWLALRRIPGRRLDLEWPGLDGGQRRAALTRLGGMLSALHQWTPPAGLASTLARAALGDCHSYADVGGSAVVPLPVKRLAPLLDWMELLPGMDPKLARRVRARLDELAPAIEDSELTDGVVVHSDAHLANVLWHRGRLTALLDFEWARIGPPDLELEAFCRDDPVIGTGTRHESCYAAEVPMLTGLKAGYPDLFAHPDLTERLWLYELAFAVRQFSAPGITVASPAQLDRLEVLAWRPRVRFR